MEIVRINKQKTVSRLETVQSTMLVAACIINTLLFKGLCCTRNIVLSFIFLQNFFQRNILIS